MLVRDIIKDNTEIFVNPGFVENPVVSIILPTYSRAKSGSLKRALDSFLRQTFKSFELIIVDDCSIDGSFDICKSYMNNDNRIKIIRHKKNVGLPAISTYEAYMESRGEYISFGFDDNTWEEDALEKTIKFYRENDVKAGYGITKILDPDTGSFVYIGKDKDYVEEILFFGNAVGEGSVILHREVFENIGLFDPHISLTRICDWDLWRRLIKQYDFVSTGIKFATEYGVTMADSLGNTRPLYNWFWAEYVQQRKTCDFLKPENYADADVFDSLGGNATDYFIEKFIESAVYYKGKYWYHRPSIEKKKSSIKKQRVLFLVFGGISASHMSFTEYDGDEYIIRFMKYGMLDPASLFLTDIVVQSRVLPENNWVAKCCKMLGIPIYYYVDDNFREIFKDNKNSLEYRNTNREYLSDYRGVIVSSHKLVEYFKDNFLHDNVIYLPPILSKQIKANNKNSSEFTIGYMGGKFREDSFIHFVIPAILKLAEKYSIKLVLPNDDELKKAVRTLSSVNVEWYERRLNYLKALDSLNKYGVDLLVHPGEKHSNNAYKTKNCLANSVLLGANLITSNIEPYCYEDELSGCYLLADNTVSSWKSKMESIISDKNFANDLMEKARKNVLYQYSTEMGWTYLRREWDEISEEKNYVDKAEKLLTFGHKFFNNPNTVSIVSHYEKTINPDAITYQPIKKCRRYRITPNLESFSKLVLAFAKEWGCVGRAKVSVCDLKGNCLASMTIQSDEMIMNGLTICELDKPVVTMGEDLILKIEAHYDSLDLYFGVFEVIAQRSFFYKIFNKIGYPLKGRNTIWVDVN